MTLIDVLPKEFGKIVLSPGGSINGENIDAHVDQQWFINNFPEIANAEVPLTDEQLQKLKNIDVYWKQNAERWRLEGLI